jgi:hypothetical protein
MSVISRMWARSVDLFLRFPCKQPTKQANNYISVNTLDLILPMNLALISYDVKLVYFFKLEFPNKYCFYSLYRSVNILLMKKQFSFFHQPHYLFVLPLPKYRPHLNRHRWGEGTVQSNHVDTCDCDKQVGWFQTATRPIQPQCS